MIAPSSPAVQDRSPSAAPPAEPRTPVMRVQSAAPTDPIDTPRGIVREPIGPAEAATKPLRLTPEEGMRFYAAILGHEPTVDPDAPDLLPHLNDHEVPATSWAGELSRSLRDELGRKLQMKLHRRPTWRELMDSVTHTASRRLDEARRRLHRRDAA